MPEKKEPQYVWYLPLSNSGRADMAVAASLLLLFLNPASAGAQESATEQLAKFENTLLGCPRTDKPLLERLGNLEKCYWGEIHRGGLKGRIEALAASVGTSPAAAPSSPAKSLTAGPAKALTAGAAKALTAARLKSGNAALLKSESVSSAPVNGAKDELESVADGPGVSDEHSFKASRPAPVTGKLKALLPILDTSAIKRPCLDSSPGLTRLARSVDPQPADESLPPMAPSYQRGGQEISGSPANSAAADAAASRSSRFTAESPRYNLLAEQQNKASLQEKGPPAVTDVGKDGKPLSAEQFNNDEIAAINAEALKSMTPQSAANFEAERKQQETKALKRKAAATTGVMAIRAGRMALNMLSRW